MDKESVLKALNDLKSKSTKRKFKQTYDLIFTFKGLDLKKPEQQMDFFVNLPHSTGKKIKVCALVGGELASQAKEACDSVIELSQFDSYGQDKKKVKKLADSNDYFIAQANLMAKVASAFGRVLGPRGKMPNPKAGCVVPSNAVLKPLIVKLQTMIRVSAKTMPMTQLAIGHEGMKDEEIIDNVMILYDNVLHHLPGGLNSLRAVYLKLTMSKPVKVS